MNLKWNNIPRTIDINNDMTDAYEERRQHYKNANKFNAELLTDITNILRAASENNLSSCKKTNLTDLFYKWRKDNAISLPYMLSAACEYFNITDDNNLKEVAFTACILGEIKHNNHYHDNNHFREVFMIVMCFCAYQLNFERQSSLMLFEDDILLLLIAAAIHDFAHDGGKSNDQENVVSRLEKQSITKAKPFLTAAGISATQLKKLELMLVCTDVIKDDLGISPADVARNIYINHESNDAEDLDTDAFYDPLVKSHKLALMARMICEADIIPSSGISYDLSKYMTVLIAKENDCINPNANTLYNFLNVVCNGGYNTPAAKALFGDTYKEILILADRDASNDVKYS